jgi:hypothetical protein
VPKSSSERKRRPWGAAFLLTGISTALGACGGNVLHSAEVIYPDAAWTAGIEGDVVVETCNSPPSPHVLSGRPELTTAALEMSAGSWKRAPRSEGTSLENCRQTRFAFRRSPTSSEAATLSAAQDTIFVTRGLKRAAVVNRPPPRDDPEWPLVEGVTDADLTIDESGHVSSVLLIKSVGGPKEMAAIAAMKEWVFVPATIEGKPFVSHSRLRIRWELP